MTPMHTPRLVAAILMGKKHSVSLGEGLEMNKDVKVLAVNAHARLDAFAEIVGLCANDPAFHPYLLTVADAIRNRHAARA